jgi:hypothetical protein
MLRPFHKGGRSREELERFQVMRQQGEDDVSIKFRLALNGLLVSQFSRESWELLCTRVANQLAPDEIAAFDSALRLYFTTEEVRETNSSRLAAADKAVKRILACHKGPTLRRLQRTRQITYAQISRYVLGLVAGE